MMISINMYPILQIKRISQQKNVTSMERVHRIDNKNEFCLRNNHDA